MKVLFLSYDGLSDPLGQSQVIPYLLGLAQKGHEITIVSFEKKNNLTNLFHSIREELDKHKIKWIFLNYTKYPPVLSTLYDLFMLRKTCEQLQRANHFQVVHCRGYITSLAGIRLKLKYGIKFIFDMRGFLADERAESGLWDQRKYRYRLVYNYFKKREKEFLVSADKIIVLTNAAKQVLSKKFPVQDSKVKMIPCCVDTDQFDPEKIDIGVQAAWKQKLSIHESDFVISYLGAIGTWYLLGEMLDFFQQLLHIHPNAKFLFITHHPKEEIWASAEKRDISKVSIIVIKAGRKEVPVLLSLSKISVYFIMPTFSKIASSPTKQAEIFSMGIPVICNTHIGDAEEIIQTSKAGLLIDQFTTQEFNQAIHKIPLLLNIKKSEIRNFAINRLSLHGGIENYDRIYNELE